MGRNSARRRPHSLSGREKPHGGVARERPHRAHGDRRIGNGDRRIGRGRRRRKVEAEARDRVVPHVGGACLASPAGMGAADEDPGGGELVTPAAGRPNVRGPPPRPHLVGHMHDARFRSQRLRHRPAGHGGDPRHTRHRPRRGRGPGRRKNRRREGGRPENRRHEGGRPENRRHEGGRNEMTKA